MRPKTKCPFQVFKDFEFKERMFQSIVDLVTLSMFLGVSPAVRENLNAINRGEKKDLTAYKTYLKHVRHAINCCCCSRPCVIGDFCFQLSMIQRDSMFWFHEIVPKTFKTCMPHYPKQLHKVLFMVPHEEYVMQDGWPAENERHIYFKATQEIPLMQDTVMRSDEKNCRH